MDTRSATASPAGAIARLRSKVRGLVGGTSEASITRRLAGTIFVIRVVSAALAYFSQILLARWMGGSDYGIYVYVWTWVLLLGSMMDSVLIRAKDHSGHWASGGLLAAARLLSGSRWMTYCRILIDLAVAGGHRQTAVALDRRQRSCRFILGCLTLPPFVVQHQDGIARSHDWMRLGLMPAVHRRQGLIIGFTAGVFVLGFICAVAAMLVSAAAVWIAVGQMLVFAVAGSTAISKRAQAYDFRGWLAVSLPILLVESFYLLLSYTDVLVLQQSFSRKRSASISPW
jgi:hypothetical protein